jgi:hypothetical protein
MKKMGLLLSFPVWIIVAFAVIVGLCACALLAIGFGFAIKKIQRPLVEDDCMTNDFYGPPEEFVQ